GHPPRREDGIEGEVYRSTRPLLSDDGWLARGHRFATGLGFLRRLHRWVAPNEQRQDGTDAAGDHDEHERVVQAKRGRVLYDTGLDRWHMRRQILWRRDRHPCRFDAGGGDSRRRALLET